MLCSSACICTGSRSVSVYDSPNLVFNLFFFMCGFNHTVCSFFFIHKKKTEVKPSPLPHSLLLRTNFGSDLRHIGNENNKRSSKAKTTETSTVCTKRQTVGTTLSLPPPTPDPSAAVYMEEHFLDEAPIVSLCYIIFLLSARGGTENRHHLLFLHSAQSKRQIHKSRNKLTKKNGAKTSRLRSRRGTSGEKKRGNVVSSSSSSSRFVIFKKERLKV